MGARPGRNSQIGTDRSERVAMEDVDGSLGSWGNASVGSGPQLQARGCQWKSDRAIDKQVAS